MGNINRKQFLKKAFLITTAAAFLQKNLLNGQVKGFVFKPSTRMPSNPDFAMNKYAIIDLHCHPVMKMYLWNKKFWKRHLLVSRGENLFHMQEDHFQFSYGNVRGILAAHYLLEAATTKEWNLLKLFFPTLKRIPFLKLNNKIEHEDATNFDQVSNMIALLNQQLDIMNSKQRNIKYVVAKNYEEFELAINDPQKKTVAVAHSIEGAHALGRNFPISEKRQKDAVEQPQTQMKMLSSSSQTYDSTRYIENLLAFKAMGVCLITLSHFFRNDLAYPVDGISPDSKKAPGMARQYTPDQDRPLTPVGVDVVRKMLEIGILVDLTHTAPLARKQIFNINKEMNEQRMQQQKPLRPLIFTHTGAQQIFEYYNQNHYPYYKYYCVSDEEIDLIAECNGVIGVIPENFWLVGADTHMRKEFYPAQFITGIPYIIQTIKYINSKTRKKNYDNVGIGTDFDGLADNPKDLYKNEQLADLIVAMQNDPEFTPMDIDKITSQNARRVLKHGWGS